MNQNNRWLLPICIGMMLVISLVLYPALPDYIPTHWNLSGEVDGYTPKLLAVLIMPVIAVVVWVALEMAPRLDPRREAYEKFAPSYYRVRVAVIVFMLGMHFLMLTQYDNSQAMVRLLLFGIAMLFAVIGNEMGRFRQTWFVGIRTPWTLADERVWRKTHRAGARYFFGLGVLNMAVALAAPMVLVAPIFILTTIGVSVGISAYSYIVFRRLNIV